jgi:hypothetical protein
MARKPKYNLGLSQELWALIDDLKGYFGEGRPEIMTYILRNWLSTNQTQISEMKAAVHQAKKGKD